jgi:hypothetical protein
VTIFNMEYEAAFPKLKFWESRRFSASQGFLLIAGAFRARDRSGNPFGAAKRLERIARFAVFTPQRRPNSDSSKILGGGGL